MTICLVDAVGEVVAIFLVKGILSSTILLDLTFMVECHPLSLRLRGAKIPVNFQPAVVFDAIAKGPPQGFCIQVNDELIVGLYAGLRNLDVVSELGVRDGVGIVVDVVCS